MARDGLPLCEAGRKATGGRRRDPGAQAEYRGSPSPWRDDEAVDSSHALEAAIEVRYRQFRDADQGRSR
jgi:hypothetical protein